MGGEWGGGGCRGKREKGGGRVGGRGGRGVREKVMAVVEWGGRN